MSGHSKWATIKHKKGAADAKRGKLFAKLIKQVEVAARTGGGDPDSNPTLRSMFQKARDSSVPIDTIERAVLRGTGELEGVNYETITYEGYAPGGVALLIECLTDNRNRTAGEVRKIFEVNSGNLGSTGCVAWMFDRKGLFTVPVENIDEDRLFEVALEAGADDVARSGDLFEVICGIDVFQQVADALEAGKIPTDVAEMTRIASTTVELDASDSRKILRLLEALDEQDDVQSVTANFNIPDEVMAEVAAEV